MILNLEDELASRICEAYSNRFNIIGLSSKDLNKEYDNVTFVKADIYKNPSKTLKEIIEYVRDEENVSIDILINNVFKNCQKTSTDDFSLNKDIFSSHFYNNVFLPTTIINYMNNDYWSNYTKEDNEEHSRQIINIYPFKEEEDSKLYSSAYSSFQEIMDSMSKKHHTDLGTSCNIINIKNLNKKEYIHCAMGMIIKLSPDPCNNTEIYIDQKNYTQIHRPCTDAIFRKNHNNDQVIKHNDNLKNSRRASLMYHLKNIKDIEIIDSKFRYAMVDMCVTDEVINDINKEFNTTIDMGIWEVDNKNLFSTSSKGGIYSYIPDIYSKFSPKNGKLIFLNNAFKELLEENFDTILSNDVYIEYCYRKPGSEATEVSTGNDIVYFPPMSAPVSCSFKMSENQGVLNVHQSENSYSNPDRNPYMLKKKQLTVIVFLNDFGDFRGEGGICFYSDIDKRDIIDSFTPKRYSMLIFENNDHSFHNFLPNNLEEKMIRIHYHVDVSEKTNNTLKSDSSNLDTEMSECKSSKRIHREIFT